MKRTWKMIPRKLRSLAGKLMAFAALIGIITGSALNASASNAVFNGGSNNYPTLQVAKADNTSPWSTSTAAHLGDVVNLLVWSNNTGSDTAHNTTVKVTLPGDKVSTHVATATLSATNAATVTGQSTISVGAASHLTYVPNSAKLYRNDTAHNTLAEVSWPTNVDRNAVVTSGVNLGDQATGPSNAQAVLVQALVDGVNPVINTNMRVQLNSGAPFDTSADANPGDVVSFKVFLANNGDGTGINPAIIDTLDNNLSYVPNSSYILVKENNQDVIQNISDSQMNFNGQTITWGFQNMGNNPSQALYLIFKAKVADSSKFPVGDTTVSNKAKATFEGVEQFTNDVSIRVHRQADQTVSFSLRTQMKNVTLGDNLWYDERLSSASAGDTVGIRLFIINTGNTAAANVLVKDMLPAGLTFAGNAKIYSATDQNGTAVPGDAIVNAGYTFANLLPGNVNGQTFYFEAKLSNTCNDNILTNSAQIIFNGQQKAQNDSQVLFACTRGLIIRKDALDVNDNQFKDDIGVVAPNQVITYRINVINNSTAPIVNPILRDVIPQNATYVADSLTIDDEVMDSVNQQKFLHEGMLLTTLTPGMSKTIKVQFKVGACAPQPTDLINTAFVKANNVAEINDTAKAKVAACGTPTPTPTPPTTPTPTPPGPTPKPTPKPTLPETGPASDLIMTLGLSGFGATVSRMYLSRKKLKKNLSNIDIA